MDDPTLTGLYTFDERYVPQDVTVLDRNMDGCTLTVSWVAPTNSVAGYRVYRSFLYDQHMTAIGITPNLSFIDSGVEQKRSYYYRVVSLY